MAQIAHESGVFRWVWEIWGPTPAQQRYEERKDLGKTQPGDGKRFMGRGLLQVTGLANYVMFNGRIKLLPGRAGLCGESRTAGTAEVGRYFGL